MKRTLALLLTLLLANACATPTVPVRRGTSMPHAIGVVCLNGDGTPVALDDPACGTDDNLRALVSGIDSVGAAMPAQRTWLDVDESTPGFTPLHMPGLPGAMAIDALTGQGYIAIPLLGWVVRVDLKGLSGYMFGVIDWQDVGVSAQDLLIVQTPEPRLYMADPAGGKVWWLPLSHFAKTVGGLAFTPKAIAIGGTPASLAWSPLSQRMYIGHLATGYLSVLEPLLGDLKHISLVAQCRNGLDDDGDGTIDRDDSGCDGPDDTLEGSPERGVLCFDRVDNDGDGFVDAADVGCNPRNADHITDACRDGKDNDGDGLTDYAAVGGDPGCTGWGDNSEWSEQALCPAGQDGCRLVANGLSIDPTVTLCGDGIDNDHDGTTDGASDCSVPGNAVEGPPPCANGVDDDRDGKTDLADPDCYNRNSLGEISPATAPRTMVAATFDGRFVVIADRTRRALLIVDTQTDELVRPVPGQTWPFARPSRLDLRDGIVGISLADVPLSLGPAQANDTITVNDKDVRVSRPLMGIGLAQVGVQFVQFYAMPGDTTPSIDIVQNALDVTPTLAAGRPLLLIPGAALDLPSTIPTRFAAFGSSLASDANNNTVYYGLAPSANHAEQRSETWRLTREGLLPGGVGTHARLLADGLLHDPTANFCAIGALPGDMLQVHVANTAACQGDGRSDVSVQTYDFPVLAVHGDQLEFDPTSGVLDVPVTYDNQLSFDPAAQIPWTSTLANCVTDGGVTYTIRAGGWLVRGSRTGILSTRAAVDGECSVLAAADRAAARAQETVLQPGKTVADLLQCPYAGDSLDPQIWQVTPLQHPGFTARLSPGCDASTYNGGDRVIKLVPSIREAEWVYGVTAGASPRTTPAGANPVAMASAPLLNTMYVIDQGAGLLQFVRISDGQLLDTPLD